MIYDSVLGCPETDEPCADSEHGSTSYIALCNISDPTTDLLLKYTTTIQFETTCIPKVS